MAKSMGLEKVKYFDPKKLKRVAVEHVTFMNKRVTKRGIDGFGRKFKKYSKGYEDLKKNDFRTEDGDRYRGYEGIALNTQVSPPNFQLRGLTMKNLRQRKVGKDFYEIGWDGEAAAIVEGNASRGRDIANEIPDLEYKWVLGKLGIVIEKEWKKIKNTTISVGR